MRTSKSVSCALAVGALVLSACAGPIVVSRPASSGATGIPYSLPRTVVVVKATIAQDSGATPKPSVELSVSTQTVADGACHYVMEHDTSSSSDDHVVVGVGTNGTLGSITAESTQEGVKILDAALNTVVAAAKLSVSGGVFGLQSAPTPQDSNQARLLAQLDARLKSQLRRVAGEHVFYWRLPSSGNATETAYPLPGNTDWSLVLTIQPVAAERATAASVDGVAPAVRGCALGEVDGVIVRGLEPFVIQAELRWNFTFENSRSIGRNDEAALALYERNMSRAANGDWGYSGPLVTATGLATIPDYSPAVVVPLDRAMFVQVKNNLTFADGTLTKSDVTRPSPIAAIAGFPAEVADTLVSLPAKLVQIRIDTMDTETELAGAETTAATAARTARDAALDDELARVNAYIDATAAADAAKQEWENALATGTATEIAAAKTNAKKAMLAANVAAAKASRPAPYSSGDIP